MRTPGIGIAAAALGLAGAAYWAAGNTERFPWPAPRTITVPAGTPIKVRTTTALSTRTVRDGATFTAILAEPLIVDGKEVAPRGAEAGGVVVRADQGGRVKGVASLTVRLMHISAGGQRVAVETSTLSKTAPTTRKKDAMKIGIGAGVGAAIGALAGGGDGAAIGAASGAGAGTGWVLGTRGEPAVIGAESLLTFRLTSPVTVKLAG
jgi:hypothetical protein